MNFKGTSANLIPMARREKTLSEEIYNKIRKLSV